MMFLPKGMFVTSLALAASAAAIGSVSAADIDLSADKLPQYTPYNGNDSTTTLLVSYKDELGHDNLVSYAKKMKGEGKSTNEKKNYKFKKSHKVDTKNFSDGKKGKSDKIKDKDRRLNLFDDIEEEEDVFITGFSVIEVDNEDIDAEIAALSALKGVATVEMDQEMHVMSMEHQQQLRGGKGAQEHIREIQDAIEATADQLLREDKFEGGGTNHGRRLAEDIPYGITMVKSAYVNAQTPPPGATPIHICVVDTGYGLGHPDLPNASQHGVNGYSPYGENERWDVDGHGHGTHCAGTVGAIGGNNIGVTSVNPDPTKFKFFIGKGLTNSGSGSTSGVMDAVQACANNGAKVISMSLGGGGYSSTINAQYEDLYEAGVLIVAAAGNDGNSGMSYPASYNTVVSVASVDSNEVRSSFSQYNDQVELAAPGTAVKSTIPSSGYATWSGTSMATPHVAGVAALLWYHFPDCTNNQIRNAMIMSSKDLGGPSWDPQYGWGLIDAEAAYNRLSNGCEEAGGPPLEPGDIPLGGKDQLGAQPTPPPTPAPTIFCAGARKQVEVVINTDNYPGETTWAVTDKCGNGGTVLSGGPYSAQGTTESSSLSVCEGEYEFRLNDAWGDGICCGYGQGSYEVKYDGEVVASGGEFGSSETTSFGSACPSPDDPTPPPTAPPTSSPTTSAPTSSPTTSAPTSSPSSSPTSVPTSSPTTSAPTSAPTSSPTTSAPTSSPTTSAPTSSPSSSPTSAPTSSPTTSAPTSSPSSSPTSAPTSSPSTSAPTSSPSSSPTSAPTSSPSSSPTNQPISPPTPSPVVPVTPAPTSGDNAEAQVAVFDSVHGVPRCANEGLSCDSGDLLDGRGTKGAGGGTEPNLSNTNKSGNTCIDGNSGTYHVDESIDQITVTAGDLDEETGNPVPSGDFIMEGGRAYVTVKLWCWSGFTSDTADIYLASDPSIPDYQLLDSVTCPGPGAQTIVRAFDVPSGTNQAMIRVNFRYGGSESTCSPGSYDDHDDIIFPVKPDPNNDGPAPTPSPVAPPSGPNGPQIALYDAGFGVPKCSHGSSCDSNDLLIGRGTMTNGEESNHPNTLNACTDGSSGSWHSDESIDKVVVTRADGGDGDFTEGDEVTISASVWCWSTPTSDYIDFYYASDAANPVWIQIGERQRCQSGGANTFTANYTLPQGSLQAVRANFMYSTGTPTPGTNKCVTGSYDDTDDMVISVKPSGAAASIAAFSSSTIPPRDDMQGPIQMMEKTVATGAPTSAPTASPTSFPTAAPTSSPTAAPTSSPTVAPTSSPTSPPTSSPTNPPTSLEVSSKTLVCGRGDIPDKPCAEGLTKTASVDEVHEIRCCRDCDGIDCNRPWRRKCKNFDSDLYARSKIDGVCKRGTFTEAQQECEISGGRLCTPREIENSCAKGTGCNFDRELVWTCGNPGYECTTDAECCGSCVNNVCVGEGASGLFA